MFSWGKKSAFKGNEIFSYYLKCSWFLLAFSVENAVLVTFFTKRYTIVNCRNLAFHVLCSLFFPSYTGLTCDLLANQYCDESTISFWVIAKLFWLQKMLILNTSWCGTFSLNGSKQYSWICCAHCSELIESDHTWGRCTSLGPDLLLSINA